MGIQIRFAVAACLIVAALWLIGREAAGQELQVLSTPSSPMPRSSAWQASCKIRVVLGSSGPGSFSFDLAPEHPLNKAILIPPGERARISFRWEPAPSDGKGLISRPLDALRLLEPLAPDAVAQLEIHFLRIGTEDLAPVARLTGLKSISIGGEISENALAHLKGMRKLEELHLFDAQIPETGLRHIAGLESLVRLSLPWRSTDASMPHIRGLHRLQSLDIPNMVTDQGLQNLFAMHELRRLNLGNRGLNSSITARLAAQQTHLAHLALPRGSRDADLEHLRGHASLTTIEIDDGRLTAQGVEALASCPALEVVALRNCGLKGADLKPLKSARSLRRLSLSRNAIGDEGATILGEIPAVHSLILTESGITSNGVESLSKLNQLRHLDLEGNAIANGALAYLTSLPNLRYLNLSMTAVTEAGLVWTWEMRGLENLDLPASISKEGIARLRRKAPWIKCHQRQPQAVIPRGTPTPGPKPIS